MSQFVPGRSAYECVAYSCALLKYAGEPGKGPTGSVIQASNAAQFEYGKYEGSNLASNENGMSLGAEYSVLSDLGMGDHHALSVTGNAAHDLPLIKAWLALGYPLAVCGAESGFYDVGLGDRVPYSWAPTGNHCIVVSGVDAAGYLLVHDCANVDSRGVRPGPRMYDGSLMRLLSATAVHKPWLPIYSQGFDPLAVLEHDMAIDINSPGVSDHFVEASADRWHCRQNGKDIAYAMLSEYKATNGLLTLGLPVSGEIPIEQVNPPVFAKYGGHGIVAQFFERGVLVYDVQHLLDNPPGAGSVYRAHLYTANALGTDPRLWASNLPKLLQAVKQPA